MEKKGKMLVKNTEIVGKDLFLQGRIKPEGE